MVYRSTMPTGLPWRIVATVLSFIVVFLGLTPPVSAADEIIITNNCPYDMWMWVVSPEEIVPDYAHQIVPAGTTFNHIMRGGGGQVIKIRDLPT
ncbi:hypothetical protein K504DRAFT_464384 [Pleomassaria siparia CBS 279.74]|uniref:Plastocyanin-like domain-containing protein n=1 Tax=Pleomassaria siparia CBS 279.74 TaxID=1314801 RepID=A0A6G1KHJ5_9PLEO|nr:hypothetical protein K504DRAFT_464384 [Pleomassaria siparia CBS 279.74]